AGVATMTPAGLPYGLIEDGAIATKGDRIAAVGPTRDVVGNGAAERAIRHDAKGRCITPGLIDCHTHLVYGGSRAREFERRLEGAASEEGSRGGGRLPPTGAPARAPPGGRAHRGPRPRPPG